MFEVDKTQESNQKVIDTLLSVGIIAGDDFCNYDRLIHKKV